MPTPGSPPPTPPASAASWTGKAAGAFIGEEAAKRAALDHAGVSASGSGFLKCELDEDDGLWVYEIEFRAEGVKYDYEIDASSGAVRKAEQEH